MIISISTSPSVYVIYSTLMAIYDCGNDLEPNVGSIHDAVTIGYPPDALSTGVCYHTNWRSINYTELYYPPPDYEVVTQAACSMDYGDPRTIDSSGILAGSPIFSIPGGISQVDPLWSSCTPASPGGYDPPRALTKTKNLVPTPILSPVTQAKPEPSAALQLAAETGAPSTANGGNVGQVPQDPSNSSGDSSQDSGAAGAGDPGAGDPGSTAGKQEGDSGSQQAPGAKGDQPDSQNPGSSNVPSHGSGGNTGSLLQGNTGDNVPGAFEGKAGGSDPQSSGTSSTSSVENGGISGSAPQDNGGNVAPGLSEGSKATSANPEGSDAPDSPSKEDTGSVSPENGSNEGSAIDAYLQEASGGGVKLGTVTIAPGAQTTHSGHVVSVGSSFVLVDGTSFDLQSSYSGAPPGIAYTTGPSQQKVAGGGVVVGTTTLAPGAQIKYSGHTISVGFERFAVDGTSYSLASSGGLIMGTTTLPLGAQTTTSGHIISVGSGSVVIDGSSYTWATGSSSPTSTPASENLGGLIMSAFGAGVAANSSASPLAFTGDAVKPRPFSRPELLTTTMIIIYVTYICIL